MAGRPETRWIKVFKDFIKHLRIDSKEVTAEDERGSPLKLWPSQELFLRELAWGLEDGVHEFFCLKSRQLGISTVSIALIDVFWPAMHPGAIGALVVESEKNRAAFRALIRRYVDSLPVGFVGKKFKIVKDNKDFMLYSNGARLDFLVAGTTASKDAWGEGQGYSFAHLTEVASYGSKVGLDSFRESLAQTNPDRLFVFESTAKGYNAWRDMWIEAGRDTTNKRRMFIGWWAKPSNAIRRHTKDFSQYGTVDPDERERELIKIVSERHHVEITPEQLAWIRRKNADVSTDEKTVQQNQPWIEEQAFQESGYSFFQVRVLQKDMERIWNAPITLPDGSEARGIHYQGYKYWVGADFFSVKTERIETMDRVHEVELKIWYEPVDREKFPNARYVIGVDPAWGRNENKDRHAISVWRCYADRLVQCAEYATPDVDTRHLAWVLAHICGVYKNCIVLIELTGGPGRAVMTEFDNLRDRMRAEMYVKPVEDRGWDDFLFNATWYLYHKPDSMGAGFIKNWETNANNKFYLMNKLRDTYVTELAEVNSSELVEEMLSVRQDGSEIGAPGNGKDDRVFAWAFANLAYVEWVRPALIAQGYTYEFAEREERGELSASTQVINQIVMNFFKTAEERAENRDDRPAWLVERGLV